MQSRSDGVFALGVDRVRDPLEQRGVVCERRDMAPVDVFGAGEEVVVAGSADAVEGPRRSRPCVRRRPRARRHSSWAWGGSPVVVSGTFQGARARPEQAESAPRLGAIR